MPDPSQTILAARPDGSFRLVLSDGTVLETFARTGGFSVAGGAGPGWWLEDLPENEAGWSLRRGDGGDAEEWGRTTRSRDGEKGLPSTLLLEDGRLMRIVARLGADPGVALIGDEVPGAYIEGSRRDSRWVFRRTTAGLDFEFDVGGWLLLAAEISWLDAE